jgi:hypothetical protein
MHNAMQGAKGSASPQTEVGWWEAQFAFAGWEAQFVRIRHARLAAYKAAHGNEIENLRRRIKERTGQDSYVWYEAGTSQQEVAKLTAGWISADPTRLIQAVLAGCGTSTKVRF